MLLGVCALTRICSIVSYTCGMYNKNYWGVSGWHYFPSNQEKGGAKRESTTIILD